LDLSILIVNWNTCGRLRECLQSVRDTAGAISHEVIVVDNASTDRSAEMVREGFPEVGLIASAENLGFARGNNLAYGRASGRHVLVLNPDVILLPGTLRGLVAFAERHSDLGCVSPGLLNPDRTPQRKYFGRLPTLSTVFFLYTRPGLFLDRRLLRHRIRRRERYEDLGDPVEPTSFTNGGVGFCCTLIPRRIVEEIGFFDERFPIFFNDGDFAARLFRTGYPAYLLPQVQAIHYGGASVQRLNARIYHKEFAYGLRTYFRKHRGWRQAAAVDCLLGLDAVAAFGRNVAQGLAGKRGIAEILSPLRDFRETLTYCPPASIPDVPEKG